MRGLQISEFGRDLDEFTRPTPVPQGQELLLKVLATGICHTDIHLCDGYYNLGGGKRLSVTARGLVPPIVPGHEVVGEIIAVGPDADAALLGTTRLVYPWAGCGTCAICTRGDYNACPTPGFVGIHRPGGYADVMVVPHGRYLLDIGDMSPQEAAPFACSGLTAYGALNKFGIDRLKSTRALVIGAGGLGLMAIAILKGVGALPPIVIEPNPARRAEALRLGAAAALDPGDDVGDAPAAIIDFVGSGETAELALSLLARGGKYVVVGLFGGELAMALPLIAMRAISIEGSNVGTLEELHALMELARAGHLPRIASTPYPLAHGNHALSALRNGEIVGRAVLQPQENA